MKLSKKLISVILAISFLCVIPLAVPAEAAGSYPVIIMGGGWHPLYYDEFIDGDYTRPNPNKRLAFDPLEVVGLISVKGDDILAAVKALNIDRAVDIIVESLWSVFEPILMTTDGESKAEDNISGFDYSYESWNVGSKKPRFDLDWRLSPIDNAKHLKDYVDYIKAYQNVDKVYIKGMSGSGPVLLAYLDIYGYDGVAGVIFENSLHNGATIFGELMKGNLSIDAEALSQTTQNIGMGFDLTELQPTLKALFDSGLLSVASELVSILAPRVIGRIYDEAIFPLLLSMPVFWSYLPVSDYKIAKAKLLDGKPEYDGLRNKTDAYFAIEERSDEILLAASKEIKVALTAGYGLPVLPIIKSNNIQSDNMLDTVYGSQGATCAPLNRPFSPWYKQAVDDGHNHISPDRYIDASTCLLPETTWIILNAQHGDHSGYSGWLDWFMATDEPTVFSNKAYPQYMESVTYWEYIPLVVEPEPFTLGSLLKTIGDFLLSIWRLIIMIPFEFIKESLI